MKGWPIRRRRPVRTMADFTWKAGAKVLLIVGIAASGAFYISERYVLGLDTQETRCLDEWIYVIDTWDRPTAAETERDQYVAVGMTDAQTPDNALWSPGQVMVKRAVATKPGDAVTVGHDGVRIRRGDAAWTHGSGLAAAHKLGLSADALSRQFILGPGEMLLMGDHPMSYDGRYYGPAHEDQVVGRVLWAF